MMRNKQLVEKLQSMIDELEMLPDNMLVTQYTSLGLMEVGSFFHELLNAEGKVVEFEGPEEYDCIVLTLN